LTREPGSEQLSIPADVAVPAGPGGSFFKHSAVLFGLNTLANVLAYLYNYLVLAFVPKALFPEFRSLVDLALIASVPYGVLLMITSKFVSRYQAQGRFAQLRRFIGGMLVRTAAISLGGLLVVVLVSPFAGRFLKIQNTGLFILAGVIPMAAIFSTLPMGFMQGSQSFWTFGLLGALNSSLKCALGLVLIGAAVVLGGGAWYTAASVGGMAGAVVAMSAVGLAVTLVRVRGMPASAEAGDDFAVGEVLRYSLPVLVMNLAFAVMAWGDMLLVKHFFTDDAADYSLACVLGRSILFLPAAFVLALFPMVSSLHARKGDPFPLLARALGAAAVLCGIGAAVLFAAPELVIRIVPRGARFLPGAPYLRWFALAMIPLGLNQIIMNFNLGRHRYASIPLYVAAAACMVTLVMVYFHRSPYDVIGVLGGVGAALFAANLALFGVERLVKRSRTKEAAP
jgi:O-antigen/teichoic acid export membrane protein